MFFLVTLERQLVMRPHTFGPKLHEEMGAQLCEEVEGTCDRKLGWIVNVTGASPPPPAPRSSRAQTLTRRLPTPPPAGFKDWGQGVVMDGTGAARFNTSFEALVFRPFPGEVVDAVVTSVNKIGFFAEVGPLLIFVSSRAMPKDETFTFQSIGEPCWVNESQDYRIKVETEVRVKIVGIKWEATTTNCIGSMRDEYLGAISD